MNRLSAGGPVAEQRGEYLIDVRLPLHCSPSPSRQSPKGDVGVKYARPPQVYLTPALADPRQRKPPLVWLGGFCVNFDP